MRTTLLLGAIGLTLALPAPGSAAAITERASVSSTGVPANADSDAPSLSGGGQFVVFESEATNLVPGDTNGLLDVFVHDRVTGTTRLVSMSSTGAQGNGVSGTTNDS